MPKKKKPTIFANDSDVAPFGFKMHDIVRTPLGICGTVIGVKYENPENKETGRVWLRYENGHEAPLEPKLAAGMMTELGYQRCAEADHIKRDVDAYTAERNKIEEQRKAVAEIQYCKENNLPIPPHLLPKPKKKKKAKEGDKKK